MICVRNHPGSSDPLNRRSINNKIHTRNIPAAKVRQFNTKTNTECVTQYWDLSGQIICRANNSSRSYFRTIWISVSRPHRWYFFPLVYFIKIKAYKYDRYEHNYPSQKLVEECQAQKNTLSTYYTIIIKLNTH